MLTDDVICKHVKMFSKNGYSQLKQLPTLHIAAPVHTKEGSTAGVESGWGALVVHDAASLLVPKYRHCVLACAAPNEANQNFILQSLAIYGVKYAANLAAQSHLGHSWSD